MDGDSHPVLLVAGVSNKLAVDLRLVLKFVFDFSHLEVSLKSPIAEMALVKKRDGCAKEDEGQAGGSEK